MYHKYLASRFFSTKAYPKTFDKILIANRGEITRRVIRTCKKMGVKTVAIYSDADREGLFVKEADEAYRVGPPPTSESYLRMDTILDIIKKSGAQAVHPGYGFLSENSKFQKLLQDNNVKFIGPPTKAIQAMGDKIESKKLAKEAKVNTIPGFLGEVNTTEDVKKIAKEIGYPVMIKASAGGGGKGMRIAYDDKEAIEAFRLCRDEAKSSFGDDRLLVEKFIVEPRHIEFQILGDSHGNYVYLPERECSVQRRNQKVIEEAPSVVMDEVTRKKMGEQALRLARSCGYESTGTCEFLLDKNKDFYFLEMNTRLQVEHPITEEITGVDIVEQMIKIAAGYKLDYTQNDIKINGHSIEYRVYAEDPARKFLPSIGFLKEYKEPLIKENVRIDTGVQEGSEISMYYDPMISKLITWGKDRKEALDLMNKIVDEYVIKGVTHNLGFCKSIVNNKAFIEGNYTTNFIPQYYPEGYKGETLTSQDSKILAIVAGQLKGAQEGFQRLEGVDYGDPKTIRKPDPVFVVVLGQHYKVEFNPDRSAATITHLNGEGKVEEVKLNDYSFTNNALVQSNFSLGDSSEKKTIQFVDIKDSIRYRLFYWGTNVEAEVYNEAQYNLSKYMAPPKKIDQTRMILAPMPGSIVSVAVAAKDTVIDGQELLVMEAMKMQNLIKSERDGVIKKVHIVPKDSVQVDQLLIEFE